MLCFSYEFGSNKEYRFRKGSDISAIQGVEYCVDKYVRRVVIRD